MKNNYNQDVFTRKDKKVRVCFATDTFLLAFHHPEFIK